MNADIKRKQSFLLRLPLSLREQANETAHADGTSLNHFITLAVAEKLSRMDRDVSSSSGPRSQFENRPIRFDPSSFIHVRSAA